jgi:tRNA A-37 threonylcarbamoyl transferase component Bud32
MVRFDSPGQGSTSRRALIREVIADCLSRRAAGEAVADEQVTAAHPDLMPELGEELAQRAAVELGHAAQPEDGAGSQPRTGCVRNGGADQATSPADMGAARSPSRGGGLCDSIPGYRIERKVSEGGQGVVYQAIQESTRRKVAIKMMRAGAFASRSDRARFDREVQVLGRLSHPNIVAIHDSGTATAGHYIVMDYIAGQPLDQHMLGPDAPASVTDILQLFRKICSAINAAHLAGIIHRDLKPRNILIDSASEPHILDFGLAKVPLSDSDASLMTMTGHFVGSLPWASPEQAEGSPEKIDMRTDVYSLGVILYQMLTGQFPYDVTGNMRDVVERIIRAEPRRPRTLRREINDEVETIVLKCLNKDRDRRYQSAGELARDLQNYLNGLPIEAKRESIGYLLRKQLKRYRVPVAVGAGFIALILIGLVTSTTLWRRAVREAATARFRLEAARNETSLSFEEYEAVIRKLRRVEEQAALLPYEVRQQDPADRLVALHRNVSAWVTELFPVSSDSLSPPSPGTLSPVVAKAIAACVGEPGHPGCPTAFAWLRANQDRVASLVEGMQHYQFQSDPAARGGLLAQQLLPSLGSVRLATNVVIASALLHHEESDPEAAAAELFAAARLSRYAGDCPFTISALVELACRDRIYSAFRWMVADAGRAGPVPAAYVRFLERDLPFPSYEHAYISEVRSLRQILSEAYGKTSDRARARLDLTSFRRVVADIDPSWGSNSFLNPTNSMKADAAALEYDQAVSIVTDLCNLLRLPEEAPTEEIEERHRQAEQSIASHPALAFLMPNFRRALELRREDRMNRDATVIVVAIHAFRDASHRWPQSIDEALASFPVSPYSRTYYGHDFVYRIVEGAPLLYAVGPNGIDDGGRGHWYRSSVEAEGVGDDVLFLAP